MDMDLPTIENAAEYIRRLQAKYGATPEPNGHAASVLDKEHLLSLLVRMEQANAKLQAERDGFLFSLQAAMLEKCLGEEPPLPPESQLRDIGELLPELGELVRG